MTIRSVSQNFDDHDECVGIVMSLRTLLLSNVPIRREHLEQIAWAEDKGTKAFIELRKMD